MVDVSTVVVAAIGHGIAIGLLGYVLRGRRAKARRDAESGDLVLEYTWRAKGFVIGLAFFFSGIFSILLAVIGSPTPSEMPWAAGMVVLFGGVLAPFGVEVFGTSVRVNSAGIRQRSGWTGRKRARWHEVESVSFSEAMGWYRLRTPYGTVRVGAFLNGVADFLALAHEHIPSQKWNGPAPKSWMYRV